MENVLAEPVNPAFVFAIPNNQKAEALAFKIIATHPYSLYRLKHFISVCAILMLCLNSPLLWTPPHLQPFLLL